MTFGSTQELPGQPSDLGESSRFLPLVLLLSAASGCAGLIYGIVWFQLLQLLLGSSAVSLGLVLGTVMGGICLGSVGLPRIISGRQHPLRVYALLELGIAIIGLLVFFIMSYAAGLYTAVGSQGLWRTLLREWISTICLLPPALLMGARLPAIARWFETTPQGVSWMGFFYGGDTIGAAFGCLLSAFYLLRVFDMATASYVAAAINMTVALVGFAVSTWLKNYSFNSPPLRRSQSHNPPPQRGESWTVYVAIALSGLCAIGAALVWTRLLSLVLGGSIYTFSIILAVFLFGLGIGRCAGSVLSRWIVQRRRALGFCQLLLSAAIAWAAYTITRSLPYWRIDPVLSANPWLTFQLDLARCMWTILPAACLWGTSFPLAVSALTSGEQDPARLVGGVYAAQMAGAITGVIGFTLVFSRSFVTQQVQQSLIGLSAAAALFMLLPKEVFSSGESGTRNAPAAHEPSRKIHSNFARVVSVVVAVLLAVVFIFSVPPVPGALVAYGRFLVRNSALKDPETREPFVPNILYTGEGVNASVAVSALPSGFRNLHVNGRIEASTQPHDIRLQQAVGHMSALYHPRPRSVLIVGFGSGVTAAAFALHPGIERIVICEIEPLIPRTVSKYFTEENNNVLQDPRVKVIYDDARNYLITTQEKFDVITSHPAHPWVQGAAALYTHEYLELEKARLNPSGVISQWVPLYETSLEAVKSEIATFFEVFPDGTIWGNDIKNGVGYGLMLLGEREARGEVPAIDLNELHLRLNRPDHLAVARSLQSIGFRSVAEVFATYAGRARDLAPWLTNGEINRDRNLRLQYLAGMTLNVFQNEIIFSDLLTYRSFPDELFAGSNEVKHALRELFRP